MAKGDYTNSSTRNAYKTKVRQQTLTKVVVDSTEKRTRAELLDMVEELFETTGEKSITAETLRAFCHILLKSVQNTTDDSVSLDSNSTASLPTSDPRVLGQLWNDRDVVKISRG
jgi:hypothetical protein|tara:strand:+ start:420 stop:761 length:342 start_codon:yes stop_codon:yes gene_type:complete